MKKLGFVPFYLFVTLMATSQNLDDLQMIRNMFQGINNENDARAIMNFKVSETDSNRLNIIEAYKGASHCMIANYVSLPWSKLKNFNGGKDRLEASIKERKEVENVYLRLLIQLNVPRILNYKTSIDTDILFLDQHMARSPLDVQFKKLMIDNLLSVVNNRERQETLSEIELTAQP